MPGIRVSFLRSAAGLQPAAETSQSPRMTTPGHRRGMMRDCRSVMPLQDAVFGLVAGNAILAQGDEIIAFHAQVEFARRRRERILRHPAHPIADDERQLL